jgi:hypothetical protein
MVDSLNMQRYISNAKHSCALFNVLSQLIQYHHQRILTKKIKTILDTLGKKRKKGKMLLEI